MKLLFLLLIPAAMVSESAYDNEPILPLDCKKNQFFFKNKEGKKARCPVKIETTQKYCNDGAFGNGGCEDKGLHTYCVR